MSSATQDKDKDKNKPKLASLVQAGEHQTEAEAINDFIFMAHDISNAYLINTSDGDVMINTGFMGSAERNKKLLETKNMESPSSPTATFLHPLFRGTLTWRGPKCPLQWSLAGTPTVPLLSDHFGSMTWGRTTHTQ